MLLSKLFFCLGMEILLQFFLFIYLLLLHYLHMLLSLSLNQYSDSSGVIWGLKKGKAGIPNLNLNEGVVTPLQTPTAGTTLNIFFRWVEIPSTKLVKNLSWTYKKLHYKEEPYQFSG